MISVYHVNTYAAVQCQKDWRFILEVSYNILWPTFFDTDNIELEYKIDSKYRAFFKFTITLDNDKVKYTVECNLWWNSIHVI